MGDATTVRAWIPTIGLTLVCALAGCAEEPPPQPKSPADESTASRVPPVREKKASPKPEPAAASSPPARAESSNKEGESEPFFGVPDQVSQDGKSYIAPEHPFMFSGRLQEGHGNCDESSGFTFANVKSFGSDQQTCSYRVTHDDAKRISVWLVTCGIPGLGERSSVFLVADLVEKSSAGMPFRQAVYEMSIKAEKSDTPVVDCFYSGMVVERKYSAAAK